MQLRWIWEDEVEPERALSTGAVLLEAVTEAGSAPAVLYGAGLVGDAVALGLWQRGADAVNGEAAEGAGVRVLRRSTGGPTAWAGDGVVYVALCLRHASVFTSCPPDRVLNRNVRGVLGGLGLSGSPAHYFGREWLSVARRPVALVGWDRLRDGRVLLELFIARERSFVPGSVLDGYPEREEPPFLGKEPITLAEAWSELRSVERIVRWIAEGHRSRFGSEVVADQSSLTDQERQAAKDDAVDFLWRPEEEDGLAWSNPRAVPIGFVSAGARLDAEGLVADVRVAGDFYQDHDAPEFLRELLVGKEPSRAGYAESINATWDSTARFIEGVTSLDSILACLLEAAPPAG